MLEELGGGLVVAAFAAGQLRFGGHQIARIRDQKIARADRVDVVVVRGDPGSDGRVLRDAFGPASPLAQPVSYSQESVYKGEMAGPDLSDDDLEEVQDKLRGWGYAG